MPYAYFNNDFYLILKIFIGNHDTKYFSFLHIMDEKNRYINQQKKPESFFYYSVSNCILRGMLICRDIL